MGACGRLREFITKHKYVLVLLILSCVFYFKLIINPSYILSPFGDGVTQSMLQENTIFAGLNNFGQLPLWNNFYFSGIPLIGNSMLPLFYLLNLLILIFPVNVFLGYSFLIHTFFAGLFTYLFAKEIGLNKFSSFVSAITFMFSSFVIGKVYPGHWTLLMVISLMPLVFYLLELLLRKKELLFSLLFGLGWALQLIAGNIQGFYFSSLALFAYFLFRMFFLYREGEKTRSLVRTSLLVGIGFMVCLLLSSVYLLPAYELSTYSLRSEGMGYEFATTNSLPFRNIITIFIPNFFGSIVDNTYWGAWPNPWAFYNNIGVLPLILGLVAVLFKRDKWVVLFTGIGLVSFLFSFGKYLPVYNLFYYLVPGIDLFRNPAEQLFIYGFFIAILAGIGSMALTEKKIRVNRRKLQGVSIAFLVIALLGLVCTSAAFIAKDKILPLGERMALARYTALHPDGTDFKQSYLPKITAGFNHIIKGSLWFSILIGAGALLLLGWSNKKISSKSLKPLLVIVILVDLLSFGLPTVDVQNPQNLYEETEVVQFLGKDDSLFRILDFAGFVPQHTAPVFGIEKVLGYDPTIIKYYAEFTNVLADLHGLQPTNLPIEFISINDISQPQILDLLNVKYLISDEEYNGSNFKLVFEQQDYILERDINIFKEFSNVTIPVYIYENEDVLPRAYIIRKTKVMENSEILRELINKEYDPREYIITEKDINRSAKSRFKEATISFYSPNKIVVQVNLSHPGFLVLSEVWYPGWRAYDNGKEIEVLRTNYVLRSVYLERGDHTIEFVYDPLTFKIGKYVSLITFIIVIGYFMTIFLINKINR